MEHSLVEKIGEYSYYLLGVLFFALMGFILYRVGMQQNKPEKP